MNFVMKVISFVIRMFRSLNMQYDMSLPTRLECVPCFKKLCYLLIVLCACTVIPRPTRVLGEFVMVVGQNRVAQTSYGENTAVNADTYGPPPSLRTRFWA